MHEEEWGRPAKSMKCRTRRSQELGSLHEQEAYELGELGELGELAAEGNMEHLEHPEREFGMAHTEVAHHEAALMEQIAHEAATTQNEVAAEALVGSLVPLAMRVARSAPAVGRATPVLTRAASRLAYGLRRSPATRQLVRVVPQILARTARTLAASAARGRPYRRARQFGSWRVRRTGRSTAGDHHSHPGALQPAPATPLSRLKVARRGAAAAPACDATLSL